MADPFAQLGISRRPANVLFGTPDVSAGALGGWSDAAVQSAAEDQAAQEEYQAAQDARAAADDARAEAARARQSEAAADDYINAEPSSREKFLTPALVGSKRFNDIAQYQQMQPSHADKTLRNQIALRIEHPDDQKIFHEAVDAGEGTWAAKQKADENMRNREFDSQLAAVGVHPKVSEGIRLKEGNSDAVREFHVSKNKMENERIEHPDDQKIFHEAVDAGEGTWVAKQKADENRRNREFDSSLAAVGVHPTEARRIRTEEGNSQAILNHHIYKNKAENERGKDPEANRLRELYKNASEMATHSAKMDPTGMGQADPELVKRMRQHGDALEAYLTSKAKPAVPVGTGTVLRPAEGAAPTTVVPIKPPVAGSPDELDQLGGITANPGATMNEKRAALAKMKEVAASIKPPKYAPISEVGRFKEAIKKKLDDAQFEVDAHDAKRAWSEAWDMEKKSMGEAIANMSKDLGIDEDTIIASLASQEAKNGVIPDAQVVPNSIIPEEMQSANPRERATGKRYVKDLFASYLARQKGRNPSEANYQNEVQNRSNEQLSDWGKDKSLEEDWPVLRRIGADGSFSQENVLNQYLKDTLPAQAKPAAAAPPAATPTSEKIAIGTPKKKP